MIAGENDKQLVLQRAREALQVARQALQDARDPQRRPAALRNVVVFGRSVSNIIENLRSRVEQFDEWYKPLSEGMARDPLLKFFYNLRSQILKQGELGTTNYAYVERLDRDAMQRLPAQRTPRASSWAIGSAAQDGRSRCRRALWSTTTSTFPPTLA